MSPTSDRSREHCQLRAHAGASYCHHELPRRRRRRLVDARRHRRRRTAPASATARPAAATRRRRGPPTPSRRSSRPRTAATAQAGSTPADLAAAVVGIAGAAGDAGASLHAELVRAGLARTAGVRVGSARRLLLRLARRRGIRPRRRHRVGRRAICEVVRSRRRVTVSAGCWETADRGSGSGIAPSSRRPARSTTEVHRPRSSTWCSPSSVSSRTSERGTGGRSAVLRRVVDAVYRMRRIELARFAPLAFEAKALGDDVARRIVADAADALAATLDAVVVPDIAGPLVLSGSILSQQRSVAEPVVQSFAPRWPTNRHVITVSDGAGRRRGAGPAARRRVRRRRGLRPNSDVARRCADRLNLGRLDLRLASDDHAEVVLGGHGSVREDGASTAGRGSARPRVGRRPRARPRARPALVLASPAPWAAHASSSLSRPRRRTSAGSSSISARASAGRPASSSRLTASAARRHSPGASRAAATAYSAASPQPAVGAGDRGEPRNAHALVVAPQRRFVQVDRLLSIAAAVGEDSAVVVGQPTRRGGAETRLPVATDDVGTRRAIWGLRRQLSRCAAVPATASGRLPARSPGTASRRRRTSLSRRAGDDVAPALPIPSLSPVIRSAGGRRHAPASPCQASSWSTGTSSSIAAPTWPTASSHRPPWLSSRLDSDRPERFGPAPRRPRRHRQVLELGRRQSGLDLGIHLIAAVREPLLPAPPTTARAPHEQLAAA